MLGQLSILIPGELIFLSRLTCHFGRYGGKGQARVILSEWEVGKPGGLEGGLWQGEFRDEQLTPQAAEQGDWKPWVSRVEGSQETKGKLHFMS